MTKEEANRLIDLYLDEELPMEMMSEFHEALQDSPELQQELTAFRWVRQAMGQALEVPAGDGQWKKRVLARLLERLCGGSVSQVAFCQRELPLEKDISL